MKTRYKLIDLHIYDNILAAAYLQQLLNSMLKVDEVIKIVILNIDKI